MSKSFNIQHFLRKAPNRLLQQYFVQHNVLAEIEFEKLILNSAVEYHPTV